MQVCLILPNVFPVPATKGGAVETLVENLINENEINHKLDLTCISVYEEEAFHISKKYKYTNFYYIENINDNKPKNLFFNTLDASFKDYMDSIYEFIKSKSYDYIIFEGGDWIGYKYLISKLGNQKCILHIHGVCECTRKEDAQIYDYYISISKYVTDKFAETGFVDKNKIFTIYNGIDLSKFDKKILDYEKTKLREKYHIKQDDIVLLFCGRTVKEKGIKELLLACKQIKDINNIKVLIVGNSNFGNNVITDYDKELIEISKDMKDKIIFTGFIHNNDLYKIYNIADIAVIPPMYEEGFGLVVIEIMASGLPIIATRSGAIPEIMDSTCGILVDKDNNVIDNLSKQISNLAQNKDLRVQMGLNGKKVCQKYCKENYYNDFVKTLYDIKD